MPLWDRLKQVFGGGPSRGRDEGIYFYVRCDRCGDRVRVRLNPSSELQQEFDESGEGVRAYSVRKMVVDQRCFRPIEVRFQFDAARRERSREIEGGTFLSREEYEAPE
jgi:hypothetical protein